MPLAHEHLLTDQVCGDVKRICNVGPIVEVIPDLPVGVAVVNYEKFTARFCGFVRHWMEVMIVSKKNPQVGLLRAFPAGSFIHSSEWKN